jgi:hypothetical protein
LPLSIVPRSWNHSQENGAEPDLAGPRHTTADRDDVDRGPGEIRDRDDHGAGDHQTRPTREYLGADHGDPEQQDVASHPAQDARKTDADPMPSSITRISVIRASERTPPSACAPRNAGKPELRDRPLLDQARASELMRLFKVLANDSRLRLLHALERAGELCVTDLASEVQMTHRPCRTSSSASRIGGSW